MSRLEQHEIAVLIKFIERINLMATVEDQLLTVIADLDAIKAALATPPVATVDLSGVNAKLDAIAAQLQPTPAAPAA